MSAECPFCGCTFIVLITGVDGEKSTMCSWCGARGPIVPATEPDWKACEMWNERGDRTSAISARVIEHSPISDWLKWKKTH